MSLRILDKASLLIALAWRNIWRNSRRSLIIIAAMSIGVWSMVVLVAFMRGISVQVVNDAIDNLTGHIQIHGKNYRDDPVVENSMAPAGDNMKALLNSAMVHAWAERVRVPAVITSERETMGVVLVGMDSHSEKKLSFIGNHIVQGRLLQPGADKGIIIGKKLAQRLNTRLGKRVVIMSQKFQGGIGDRGFRITGIFDTKLESMETGFVFINKALAQQLLGMGERISEVGIRMKQGAPLDPLLEKLRAAAPGLDIQPWQVLEPLVQTRVRLGDGFAYIWYLVVFLAMGFGLVNTLLMAIFERTREFGLFQALGFKSVYIIIQVCFEALFLLAMALVVGNMISWLTIWYVDTGIDVSHFARGAQLVGLSNVIPLVVTATDLVSANVVVAGLGLLASLYPAWRASHYVPVAAITRN